jgi:hypothetical protein
MSSPFSTIEEFEGAIDGETAGAIYTFAANPGVNAIALLICVGLFLWFMVSTFSTRYTPSSMDKSISHLSVLLVAGMLTLLGMEQPRPGSQSDPVAASSQVTSDRRPSPVPVGLLGMLGLGLPTAAQKKGRYSGRRLRR